jgi:sulfocyanin
MGPLGSKARGMATLAVCALITAACQTGEQSETDTARATDSATNAPPAPAPTPQGQVDYTIDPKDVRGALKFDSATNTVTYPIISGLTSVNGAWNFNGHYNGSMTIVVPVGANVVMPFANSDGNVPHSFGIITGTANAIPAAPGAPALPGAETKRYVAGLRSTERDVVRFTADKAGMYLLICGVPGHAVGGMWIYFEVSSTAKRPEIRIS